MNLCCNDRVLRRSTGIQDTVIANKVWEKDAVIAITSDLPVCWLITSHFATVLWWLSGLASCFTSEMASSFINEVKQSRGLLRGLKSAVIAKVVKQSSGFRHKDAALSGLPRRLSLLAMTGVLDCRLCDNQRLASLLA